MSKIVKFPRLKDTTLYTNDGGNLGVIDKSTKLELVHLDGDFMIVMKGGEEVTFKDRGDLAEFLWVCASFVDSEERFRPTEMIGLDYE